MSILWGRGFVGSVGKVEGITVVVVHVENMYIPLHSCCSMRWDGRGGGGEGRTPMG